MKKTLTVKKKHAAQRAMLPAVRSGVIRSAPVALFLSNGRTMTTLPWPLPPPQADEADNDVKI